MWLYHLLILTAKAMLGVLAPFNTKLKRFVDGRKKVFAQLEKVMAPDRPTIWMHAASLGEYEQGLPILEALQTNYPHYTYLVTFFSPSGYEVKKNSTVADVISYLPLDTPAQAKRFLAIVKPSLAIFIKYEIWPNYLKLLQAQQIPTLLVSAIFNKKQIYFKPYGGLMRKSLARFTQIFVQNQASKSLLATLSISAEVSGDTRFDRVAAIVERNNQLGFVEDFLNGQPCLVVGSSWPEDEAVLLPYLNRATGFKTIIAPHDLKPNHLENLKAQVNRPTVLYSERETKTLSDFEVLIVDTIGLLTKIYSYATIAYVGGGFKTGLHNTLEPAVFGIPVLIGPQYNRFAEAEALVAKGGLISIESTDGLERQLHTLWSDPELRQRLGALNRHFVQEQQGATPTIMAYLKKVL